MSVIDEEKSNLEEKDPKKSVSKVLQDLKLILLSAFTLAIGVLIFFGILKIKPRFSVIYSNSRSFSIALIVIATGGLIYGLYIELKKDKSNCI